MSAAIVVTEQSEGAGAVVYWRLSGTLDPEDLAVPWGEAGLELDPAWLPELPTPATALRRAVQELSGRRELVRPLDSRGAFALVEERTVKEAENDVEATATTRTLSHEVVLRIRLVEEAGAHVPSFDPAEHPACAKIRAQYDRERLVCSAADVGGWLSRIARTACDATALRDSGGIYFVPPARLERWRLIARAIERVSGHVVFEIPAMKTADATRAILDAIEAEAAQEAERLELELQEMIGAEKPISDRVIETRKARAARMTEKVGRYEALLGASLEKIRARLEALQVALVTQALVAAPAAE